MSVVHRSRVFAARVARATKRSRNHLRAGLCGLRFRHGIDWLALRDNYDRIRDHIEATIPGFEQFNQRVRATDGFILQHGPRAQLCDRHRARQLPVSPLPTHAATGRAADDDSHPRSVQHDDLWAKRSLSRHLRRSSRDLDERRRSHRARSVGQSSWSICTVTLRKRCAQPDALSRCPIRFRAAAQQRTFPKPTSSFRSTVTPTRAAHRPRSPWSSPSRPAIRSKRHPAFPIRWEHCVRVRYGQTLRTACEVRFARHQLAAPKRRYSPDDGPKQVHRTELIATNVDRLHPTVRGL